MRSRILVALVALAGLLAATSAVYAAPVDGWAHIAHSSTSVSPTVEHYSALWHACNDKPGCQPGRNIRQNGVRTRHGTRPALRVDYRASSATLDRWLHPPAVVTPAITTGATAASYSSSTPVTSTAGGMPACTWRPESGGSYTAVNPTSGAYGKYQIIPSTWAAHCSGISRNPAGQETCARRVMAAQGAGAWVNC